MIEALFEKLHGALSENTLRAYRGDYNHFITWCQEHRLKKLCCAVAGQVNQV